MALKDRYFSVSQAAKEIGVTRQSLHRWIASGKIPAEKVGRETLIKKRDLYEYHHRRLSLVAADEVITLVGAKLTEYFREKDIINKDERLTELRPGKENTILVKKADGTLRTIQITEKQKDEAFEYCVEPLAKFLYYFDQAVAKKYPALFKQKVIKERRKTSK